jgi:hypothetical protein
MHVTYGIPSYSAYVAAESRVRISPGSRVCRAMLRSRTRVEERRSAAGIPFPEMSATTARTESGPHSMKS